MTVHVRPVQETDYDDILKIYSFESVIEQTAQLPHESKEFWKNFYSSKGVRCVELVALHDKTPAGHMGILLNEAPRRKHVASFGIAVHPDFQGKGCGRALMQELVNMADNWLNILKIELEVSCENKKAIELYKKFDFTIEGESRFSLFTRGTYTHSYRMARFNQLMIPG